MFVLAVIFNVLIAAIAAMSGVLKLQRHPKVVNSLRDVVKIPDSALPILAALELAGALGAIVGLWIAPIGIAAGIGLTLYFIGAIAAHVRVGDTKGVTGPIGPLVLSAVALSLRILSA